MPIRVHWSLNSLVLLTHKLVDMCSKSALRGDQLIISALLDDAAVKYTVDPVDLGKEVQSVCDENARLVAAVARENVVEDGFADVRVEG